MLSSRNPRAKIDFKTEERGATGNVSRSGEVAAYALVHVEAFLES
jgi:uncharacterized membrane protein